MSSSYQTGPAGTNLPGLPRGPRGPRVGTLRDTVTVRQPSMGNVLPRDEGYRPFPAPPPDWEGSDGEWSIFWSHGPGRTDRGPEGILWYFQIPLGGAQRFAVDFLEQDLGIAIDVLGQAEVPGNRRASLLLREAGLRAFGYRYIIIDEDVALTTPIWALREALAGVSHSRQQ